MATKNKCPHCGRECASAAGLAAHVRTAHKSVSETNGTATKPAVAPTPEKQAMVPANHKCPDCDREFDTPDGLHLHRVRVHGAEKKPQRRSSSPRPKRDEEPPVVVNLCFCPGCGMNLKLLAHALAAIGGLQGNG